MSDQQIKPRELEVSEYGRYIVWLAEWSWYGGQSRGSCIFSNKEAAIEWARSQTTGNVDWNNFPDPKRKYPDDDRDGSNSDLTPLFVAQWDTYGGGYASVTRTEVAEHANAG